MKSPVYNVMAIPIEMVKANTYNPNTQDSVAFKLLQLSILEDGYTQPVVCYYDKENNIYEIVDGFHRYLAMIKNKRIFEKENGLLPITLIDKPIENRMASTIRHNRAKGEHNTALMVNIVTELKQIGQSDSWIVKHLGMDFDELLRLKQLSGLIELFKDKDFTEI